MSTDKVQVAVRVRPVNRRESPADEGTDVIVAKEITQGVPSVRFPLNFMQFKVKFKG